MTISVVIVDDEYLAIKVLQEYASRLENLTIDATFKNPVEALAYLEKHKTHLLLLDIQMPQLNGFELLSKLPDPPMVVFTTARHDFAVKAFDLKVLDYLVKPIPFERFKQAIDRVTEQKEMNRVVENQAKKEGQFLDIRSDYKSVRIPTNEIIYIEGLNEYVKVYTTGKMYITLASLRDLESKLPENDFVRIHKSFIVSLRNIASYNRQTVKLNNGKELVIGRAYKAGFLERIKNNTQI